MDFKLIALISFHFEKDIVDGYTLVSIVIRHIDRNIDKRQTERQIDK